MSDAAGKAPNRGIAAPLCATRAVLNRVGDQWSFLIIGMLESGTLRFGELKARVQGISPRVLTQTLRSLEQDGLITRQAFATIPPRVDYSITALGRSLAAAMRPLVAWAEANQSTINERRQAMRDDQAA